MFHLSRAANCCEWTSVLSLWNQISPPTKSLSVQSASRFCRKSTQNDDFPEPLGSHYARKGMLVFEISTHGQRMSLMKPLQMIKREGNRSYFTRTGQTIIFQSSLQKEILYSLSSGSVIIETRPHPFLLRLLFFSVCTVTVVRVSPVQAKIMSLFTSKFTIAKRYNIV